jgi:putative membrane protein
MRKLSIRFAAAGATLCLMPATAWAQASPGAGQYSCWGPHMMGWGGGWSGMIFGPLMMILVLALPVAALVLLIRWLGGSRSSASPGQTPLDILRERYARGEIDKEEFEERRRTLGD